MKILITAFICISKSIVNSDGSNSSLFESKVVGGFLSDKNFNVKYIGFIVSASDYLKRLSTATFISERNCLVPMELAKKIGISSRNYRAESPVFLGQKIYYIHKVLYKDTEDEIAAYWGVVKILKEVQSDKLYIRFVNPRLPEFKMDREYYVGGWEKVRGGRTVLSYLELQLTSFDVCKNQIKTVYLKNLHNLACAIVKDGSFNKIEVGTGLFLDDDQLVGIAVKLGLGVSRYNIFALLYNDFKFISEFVIEPRKPSNSKEKDKGKGKAHAESSNAYFESPGVVDTPCLPDTNSKHLGCMGASNPGLMGDYGQGQMYGYDQHSMAAHHQGHAGAWNLNAMGTHHQGPTAAHDPKLVSDWSQYQMGGLNLNPIGTHHQGPTDACDPSLLYSWNQDQMGASNLNPMDTHHQSEINSHQPSYISPQNTNDVDDLMAIFKSSKQIKTRVSQSTHGLHQVHDGSFSAMPFREALGNPNFLDTARVTRTKHSKNPSSRSKRQEK